jgi:ATP-dependent Clp protease ATP-binding subunit ClpA
MTQLAAQAAQASTPLEALRIASWLRRELDRFERQQVMRALDHGTTFAQIARYLGVSRQAAHRRFRSLADAGLPVGATPGVRRVLESARREATALGAEAAAEEHVLLASLRAADLPAAAILHHAGATFARARRLLETASPAVPQPGQAVAAGVLPTVLAAAAREARSREDREVEVEHLLIGTLRGRESGAVRLLRAFDIDIDAVRAELAALLESEPA